MKGLSELREYESIILYLERTGVPHRVTSTTGGKHSKNSYHYIGCAIDAAGPTPSRNSQQLLDVFAAFGSVESQLAELIYSGAPYNIKDGRRVRRYAIDSHWDHVHIAVPRGTFLVPPKPKVPPMYDPPHILEPIVADLACPTGGTWLLADSGAIYAYGGAPYHGAPNGKPYFEGRTAARLELVDGKYRVVATSGEKYGPVF